MTRSRSLLAIALLAAACGPATSSGGETTPTLPGSDPIGATEKEPEAKKPAKKPPEKKADDPWAKRTDLIKAPPAAPPAKVTLPKIERYELPNGMKVLLVPSRDLPVVSFQMAVGAGAGQETRDKRGLADFTAAMLPKGSKKKNAEQIADAIDFVGGSLVAGADYEVTQVSCEVLARHTATCLELLPEVVTAPAFDAAAADEVRQQLHGAIRQRRDDPATLAQEHFENMLWGEEHVRGWPVTGGTIDAIGVEDLRAWHAAWYRPNNTILAVAGDFDPAQMKTQLAKAFGGWKRAELPKLPSYKEPELDGVRVRLVDRADLTQSHILVGHLGIAHTDPAYMPTLLMNWALGGGGFSSRLMKAVRAEGGKSYGATSAFDRYKTRGAFLASTFTRTDQTAATLKIVLGELATMQGKGPSEAELADAKSNIAGGYPLEFQSSGAVARALLGAELHGLGDDWVREFPVRVSSVTLADARAAAKVQLQPKDLVVVIVGNAKAVGPQLEKMGLEYERVGWLDPVSKRDRDAANQAASAPKDPKKEAEGRKLLDQAVAARGGEKKLAAVKSVKQTGTLTLQAPNGAAVAGEYARWYEAPDRFRVDMTVEGKGTITFVIAGGKAWVEYNGQIQDLPDDAVDTLGVVSFADLDRVLLVYKEKGAVVQKGQPETVDGKQYDAVKVMSGDGRYTALVLLDPKSHLVFGVCYQIEGETLCDEYGDYKAVGGVQMPHTIRSIALILQGVPFEAKLDKVEVNAPIPADVWKKKAK